MVTVAGVSSWSWSANALDTWSRRLFRAQLLDLVPDVQKVHRAGTSPVVMAPQEPQFHSRPAGQEGVGRQRYLSMAKDILCSSHWWFIASPVFVRWRRPLLQVQALPLRD